MEYSEHLSAIIDYLRGESWIIQVFVIIFSALVLDFIQKRTISKLYRRLRKTSGNWDDALMGALQTPVTVFIWLIGLTLAADIVRRQNDAFVFNIIDPVREIGVIVIMAWFLLRFIQRVADNVVTKGQQNDPAYDRTTADALAKLLRISIVITSGLVILQTLGYSVAGVLAFGGVGGIAIGFAARDMLANFFGGMMIYMDRPFAIGDWIRSPDQEIEGTVEKIGWRITSIRTFDKRPLYVPNAVFSTIAVENPSRMTNRRIYETIGIRYDDLHKMADIVADVKQMLLDHEAIESNLTMIVNFNEFADSSLNFFIYTFTKTKAWVEYHEIKQDVLLKISDIIEKHGAEVAFPTRTLHVPDGIEMAQASAAAG